MVRCRKSSRVFSGINWLCNSGWSGIRGPRLQTGIGPSTRLRAPLSAPRGFASRILRCFPGDDQSIRVVSPCRVSAFLRHRRLPAYRLARSQFEQSGERTSLARSRRDGAVEFVIRRQRQGFRALHSTPPTSQLPSPIRVVKYPWGLGALARPMAAVAFSNRNTRLHRGAFQPGKQDPAPHIFNSSFFRSRAARRRPTARGRGPRTRPRSSLQLSAGSGLRATTGATLPKAQGDNLGFSEGRLLRPLCGVCS